MSKNATKNIMIVGVGGQGSLLASKLLGKLLLEKGFDVKVSEVHGMSQRGGSVVTYVRYGDKVHSPIIDKGGADMIHIDVMDGIFVPNISFGMPIISSIRPKSSSFFDVHLMITEPIRYIEDFANSQYKSFKNTCTYFCILV